MLLIDYKPPYEMNHAVTCEGDERGDRIPVVLKSCPDRMGYFQASNHTWMGWRVYVLMDGCYFGESYDSPCHSLFVRPPEQASGTVNLEGGWRKERMMQMMGLYSGTKTKRRMEMEIVYWYKRPGWMECVGCFH